MDFQNNNNRPFCDAPEHTDGQSTPAVHVSSMLTMFPPLNPHQVKLTSIRSIS